jgi:hypothetical protein
MRQNNPASAANSDLHRANESRDCNWLRMYNFTTFRFLQIKFWQNEAKMINLFKGAEPCPLSNSTPRNIRTLATASEHRFGFAFDRSNPNATN